MKKNGKSPMSELSTQLSRRRVKVYHMVNEGGWFDQGTGQVSVDYLESSKELGLLVIDEEDNETLLFHRISSRDIYKKQEGTIISWRDPEFATELALSFQEETGCSYIWDHICSVQRIKPSNAHNSGSLQCVTSHVKQIHGWLPIVELSTLPVILQTVIESGTGDHLRLADLILRDQDFFPKLMDLFRICEDLKNTPALHLIFQIVRRIVLFNNLQIFEKIFSEELIMDIIGTLEYDPDLPEVQHRKILREEVVFKEAIPIRDSVVLSKIHQTYRIGYLKDVVFRKITDEAVFTTLTSMVHANNAIVISLLYDNRNFIQDLFAKLRSASDCLETKSNLVSFLHEFCRLSKSLQVPQQFKLSRELMNKGIFDVISDLLLSEDNKFVLIGTDILVHFLQTDPNLLRTSVSRPQNVPLFGILIRGLVKEFAVDIYGPFLDIIRCLLDSIKSGSQQRDTIHEAFYDQHLVLLLDAITSSCPAEPVQNSGGSQIRVKPDILVHISDLLCYCVKHHAYRIKCNFLLNNVIEKVLLLTRRRETYLVVAAVRFVRTILDRNDEHVSNHVVKNNLLKPIVDIFVANGNRYNMLHSVILDLFEHIRKDDSKTLLKYLVVSFWDQLVKFENLKSIRALKDGYDQFVEGSEKRSDPIMMVPKKRVDLRAMGNVEDSSADGSGDDISAVVSMPITKTMCSAANCQSSSTQPVVLVDYEDDKEEKEYKLPPKKQLVTFNIDKETDALKRKSVHKPPGMVHFKKQRLLGNLEGNNTGLFATICSSFSNVSKSFLNRSGAEKTKEKETSCSAALSACTEIPKGSSDDNTQPPPTSSPKMM